MDEDFTYFLQFRKLVESNNHSVDDVDFMLGNILEMDEMGFAEASNRTSVDSIGNDLIFYMKNIMFMIRFYEDREEYEQCQLLKEKLNKVKIKIQRKWIH